MTRLLPTGRLTPLQAWLGSLIAFAASVILGLCYLQEPGLGDDLDYWSLARRLHDGEVAKWNLGFHDLRWPVWGVIWCLQSLFGKGLAAYWGESLFYLGLGSAAVWWLAYFTTRHALFCGLAAFLFAMHPMLDPAIVRPMPDLSEGVWSAWSVVCWMALTRTRSPWGKAAWATAMGCCWMIGYSNRITGIFILPILALLCLLYTRKNFGWLLFAFGVAGLFFLAECKIYEHVTGDFLHSLHANLGAKGRKGTEPVALWFLPVRFFDALWSGNFFKVPSNLLALGGAIWIWRRGKAADRSWVVWAVSFYLLFSCAPQSLWPYRPIVRDGDRFLASLAFPLSLLSARGLWVAWKWALRCHDWARVLATRPLACRTLLVLGVISISSRDFYSTGFVPQFRAEITGTAPGTRVLSHSDLREVCLLVGGAHAKSLQWVIPSDLFRPKPLEIEAAQQCEKMWLNRKLLWVSTRKKLERGELSTQEPLPPYFNNLGDGWHLERVCSRADYPDMAFFTRITGASIAHAVKPDAWQGLDLIPESKMTQQMRDGITLEIPPDWRGGNLLLEWHASGNTVEAAKFVEIEWFRGTRTLGAQVWTPYLFPGGGWDFFTFSAPEGADSATVKTVFSKKFTRISIANLLLQHYDRQQNP